MPRNSPPSRVWAAHVAQATNYRTGNATGPPDDTEMPLSAMQVVKRFDGRLTYRMLDYWLRMGIATCTTGAKGSGTRRGFTPDEICALEDIVEIRAQTLQTLADFSSGELFAERLAYHQARNRMQLMDDGA